MLTSKVTSRTALQESFADTEIPHLGFLFCVVIWIIWIANASNCSCYRTHQASCMDGKRFVALIVLYEFVCASLLLVVADFFQNLEKKKSSTDYWSWVAVCFLSIAGLVFKDSGAAILSCSSALASSSALCHISRMLHSFGLRFWFSPAHRNQLSVQVEVKGVKVRTPNLESLGRLKTKTCDQGCHGHVYVCKPWSRLLPGFLSQNQATPLDICVIWFQELPCSFISASISILMLIHIEFPKVPKT